MFMYFSTSATPSCALRAADIPKGIHIFPHGSTDFDKGRAVSEPKLEQVQSGYKFGMKLYCTTGGGIIANKGGCEVEVVLESKASWL